VGGRAALAGDLHRLEQAERLQPPLRALDLRAVEGIALGEIELAADHLLAGAVVAVHDDALDVLVRPGLEREHEVDGFGRDVALRARTPGYETLAAPAHRDRQLLARLLHRFAVIGVAGGDAQRRAVGRGVERGNTRLDGDGAEPVALALLD